MCILGMFLSKLGFMSILGMLLNKLKQFFKFHSLYYKSDKNERNSVHCACPCITCLQLSMY